LGGFRNKSVREDLSPGQGVDPIHLLCWGGSGGKEKGQRRAEWGAEYGEAAGEINPAHTLAQRTLSLSHAHAHTHTRTYAHTHAHTHTHTHMHRLIQRPACTTSHLVAVAVLPGGLHLQLLELIPAGAIVRQEQGASGGVKDLARFGEGCVAFRGAVSVGSEQGGGGVEG
jgi:hypothetical protein